MRRPRVTYEFLTGPASRSSALATSPWLLHPGCSALAKQFLVRLFVETDHQRLALA